MSFDSAELEELRSAFPTVDRSGFIALGFVGERAMYIPVFRMSVAEANRIANVEGDNSLPKGHPQGGPQPILWQVTGFFERDLDFFLQAMETNIAFAKMPTPRDSGFAASLEERDKLMRRKYYILSTMFLPSLSIAVEMEGRDLAYVRDVEAALAVELYRQTNGVLPDSLQAAGVHLIDPFDGAPLRYHKRPERGYVIYSVEPDLQDDQGMDLPEKVKYPITNRYDVTFVVDR